MFNPLLNVDPSSLSDSEIEDKIAKINKNLNAAHNTQSSHAVKQMQNLLEIYMIEQYERMEIQMFKDYYETDDVTTLTLDDETEEDVSSNKPKVEEKEGGKLSLFRKIMNQQSDEK